MPCRKPDATVDVPPGTLQTNMMPHAQLEPLGPITRGSQNQTLDNYYHAYL